jgi:hypothetical protein
MDPGTDPPGDPASRVSRRTVLRSAGVLAVGGLGAAAGYGLRGLVGETPPATGDPTLAPYGRVAGETAPPSQAPGGEAPGGDAAAEDEAPAPPRHAFRSRPDLVPPVLIVGTPASGTAPGLVFTTPDNGDGPDGPTIYDESGQPVWVRPGSGRQATDLQVVAWAGAPALAWWEGAATIGVGDGEFVIADAGYREVARVAGGSHADLHELHFTPSGSALFIVYRVVPMPASAKAPPGASSPPVASPGGASAPASAPAPPETFYDCVLLEIDPVTGDRLWEWHAADHIPPEESHAPWPDDPATPWDPVHTNSVHLDTDGNVLMSARNTSCVYKIDRATGRIRWRLGGRGDGLRLLDGLDVGLQHDARRQPDGTITIFDNRRPPEAARGIVVEVDEVAGTARLVRAFERPEPLQAASQGSYQALANGNVLIGWGSQPVMTEFDAAGSVVWDASMPGGIQSYRNRRHPWVGHPAEPPAIAADPIGRGSGTQRRVTAYASWNGATEVRAWRLLAGGDEGDLEALGTTPRSGFETVLTGVTTIDPVTRVKAVALDAGGDVLGESGIVAPPA